MSTERVHRETRSRWAHPLPRFGLLFCVAALAGFPLRPGRPTTLAIAWMADAGVVSTRRGRVSRTGAAAPPVADTPVTGRRPDATAVRGGATVLVVDDEDAIRRAMQRFLERQGYTVRCAEDGVEALRLLEASPGCVSLVITDLLMPDMDGRELARRVSALPRPPRVLCMSGYAADASVHGDLLDGGWQFLQKPFTLESLAIAVRASLATTVPAGSP